MWVLECDGDVLKNKKYWLRPGKRYLFGRTMGVNGNFAVEKKSISRKHLTIEVAQVNPGDGSRIHARSKITIEDQNSKSGTVLNGKRIRGQTEVLQGDQHEIYLGHYEQPFRIRWKPVVFAFSVSAKQQEKNRDPLLDIRSRLEALDVKVTIPYVIGKTTHVVATKRNTPKGLQALINGQYIVTNAFVDALFKAATAAEPDVAESEAPLEQDFEAAWPDAIQCLPPPSQEPNPSPAEFLVPDSRRSTVFEGYVFVFCDRNQFENLLPPITNGDGKALMYEIENGRTTADDLVRYMRRAAGKKGSEDFRNGDETGGVILVRFRAAGEWEKWSIELGNQVAQALDQRLIEQSQFLEAIVLNNARMLRRALPEDDDRGSRTGPRPIATGRPSRSGEANSTRHEAVASSGQPAVDLTRSPPRRARTRRPIRSQFKGFDDGFDPAAVSQPPKRFDGSSQPKETQEEPSSQASAAEEAQPVTSRKRPAPMIQEEDYEDVMGQLFPAAAVMKKRKIEEENTGADRQNPVSESPSDRERGARRPAGRKKTEIDVLAVARDRREAEDEAARRDEESLRAKHDGLDVARLRNLAIIEEMPVRRRGRDSDAFDTVGGGTDRSRWDDKWNGRKNFKRFRRKGTTEADQARTSSSTVIVGLQEASGRGSGREYEILPFEAGHEKGRRGKSRERQTSFISDPPRRHRSKTPPQSQPFATARSQQSDSDEEDLPDVMDLTREAISTAAAPARTRTTRSGDKTKTARQLPATSSSTATAMAEPAAPSNSPSTITASPRGSTAKSRGKRAAPASGVLTRAAPAKKQRTLFVQQSDSSEDSDDDDDDDDEEQQRRRFRFDRTKD